jgi:hypothetical protein
MNQLTNLGGTSYRNEDMYKSLLETTGEMGDPSFVTALTTGLLHKHSQYAGRFSDQ